MLNFAARPPHVNAKEIVQSSPAVLGVGQTPNPYLGGFNVTISAQLLAVPARVLPAPAISYAQNRPGKVSEGGWNMINLRVTKGGNLESWIPIFLSMGNERPQVPPDVVPGKIQELQRSLAKLGLNVRPPGQFQLERLPPVGHDDFDSELRENVFEKYAKNFKHIFLIIPSRSEPAYKRIKYYADVVYGVHCNIICSNHLKKDGFQFEQYVANVGLKVNLKYGGRNQTMDAQRMGLLGNDKTMVVGIDVTHPSPGSTDKAPSVAAMVANIDRYCAQYPAVLRVQAKRRDEMVADLDEMLQTRLKLWKSMGKHGEYPENILVFRDGVSEGQYDLVLRHELPLLRKACQTLYPAQTQKQGLPRFFIAICGKRHNTRFYPTDLSKADQKTSNNMPGTVVDRGVTEPRNWDFFLQAHKALQGTARPAHFYMIHDEVFTNKSVVSKLNKPGYSTQDIVEEMCHHMAYLYPRATKAVSLCPPAKLADMACDRARSYLKAYYEPDASQTASQASGATSNPLNDQRNLINIHERLRDTMFYI